MRRSCTVLCFVLALNWVSGCESEPPPPSTAKVSGTVRLGGKPIPTGEIHFGMDGIPPSVLQINAGEFAGEANVGANKVEVYVYVEGPPSAKYGGMRSKTNTVPEQYWGANTTLSASVTETGDNVFKFDLKAR